MYVHLYSNVIYFEEENIYKSFSQQFIRNILSKLTQKLKMIHIIVMYHYHTYTHISYKKY